MNLNRASNASYGETHYEYISYRLYLFPRSVNKLVCAKADCVANRNEAAGGSEKLAYYLGTWKGEGETKGGPFGPAGKLSSTTTCEWFAGGFHLVCRGEEKGPTGTRTFLNIRAYDENAKAYTEYGISSLGDNEYQTGGSIVGNRKTFAFDTDIGGKPTKLRYTEVQLSPTLFTYQAEASIDGGPWTVIAEGKVRKVQ